MDSFESLASQSSEAAFFWDGWMDGGGGADGDGGVNKLQGLNSRAIWLECLPSVQ